MVKITDNAILGGCPGTDLGHSYLALGTYDASNPFHQVLNLYTYNDGSYNSTLGPNYDLTAAGLVSDFNFEDVTSSIPGRAHFVGDVVFFKATQTAGTVGSPIVDKIVFLSPSGITICDTGWNEGFVGGAPSPGSSTSPNPIVGPVVMPGTSEIYYIIVTELPSTTYQVYVTTVGSGSATTLGPPSSLGAGGGLIACSGLLAVPGARFNIGTASWTAYPSDISVGFNSDGALPCAICGQFPGCVPYLSQFAYSQAFPIAQPSTSGLSVILYPAYDTVSMVTGAIRVTPPLANTSGCAWTGFVPDLLPDGSGSGPAFFFCRD